MTYKKFYFGKLNAQILKKIDQKSQTLFGKLKKENPFRLYWSRYLICNDC